MLKQKLGCLVGCTLSLLCSSLAAETVPVDFSVDPLRSQIEFTISSLGSTDTDDTAVSGIFETQLDIDPSGGDPSIESIAFIGDRLFMNDPLNFTIDTVIIIPVTIDIEVTNMSGIPGTPIPPGPGPVTPSTPDNLNFEFDASFHTLTLDQGLITVSGAIEREIDLASDPQVGSVGPGLTGGIALTETGMNGGLTEFDAGLFLPISLIINIDLETGIPAVPMIPVEIIALGEVHALGSFEVDLGSGGPDADFDMDGHVDGDDFLIWQAGFNVDDRGDANGDGVTDGDDFLIWQSQFGTGGGTASAVVPEPAAIGILLTVGGIAIACCRMRRTPVC